MYNYSLAHILAFINTMSGYELTAVLHNIFVA